jgi:hypothetical protein
MRNLKTILLIGITVVFFAFKSNQIFNTSLKINVRNELGNIEKDVSVQLFGNEKDYREEKNPVTEKQFTDKKGNVTFKELESKIYFVNASNGDKNNVNAGVETAKLEEGKMNKVTIIIE